jgi:hypothetical protein
MTYILKLTPGSRMREVGALNSPLVKCVTAVDADRMRVELEPGADEAEYEALLDSDRDVAAWMEAI